MTGSQILEDEVCALSYLICIVLADAYYSDSQLTASPIEGRGPLQSTRSPRNGEPEDLFAERLLEWQRNRIKRRLKGEYQSQVHQLNELVRNLTVYKLDDHILNLTRLRRLGGIFQHHYAYQKSRFKARTTLDPDFWLVW